ncbi:MAG: hypothetical protein AMJ75_06005 [Phycisphaerae bacterium SM1_79]|nr:MAG: hypothetical protein AMJ75_06005 [Phycisphaerae bacterium SM1_79]
MAEQKFCQDCTQKHDCQELYRQLGHMKGPSVVVEVVCAFLLPLVIFIASLAAFEAILAGAISIPSMRTALSLLLALLVASVCVWMMGVINRRRNQDRSSWAPGQ